MTFAETVLLLVFLNTTSLAGEGEKPASAKDDTAAKANNAKYSFHMINAGQIHVDSALIVLDKFDRTGAGVVIQRVIPDENNRLTLTDVPAGKYYAGIYTYGLQREYFSIVIEVEKPRRKKRRDRNKVVIRISDTDRYIPGMAVIPPENPALFLYVRH